MNIARMSALQLALVGLFDRGGRPAARRRDLPPLRAFVEEVGAPLGEPDVRARYLDPPDSRRAALWDLQVKDRPLAGLLLLLFERGGGFLAQLVAGRGAVARLERRVKAVRHRRRVALSIARATGTEWKGDQACGCKGPRSHDTDLLPPCRPGQNGVAPERAALTLVRRPGRRRPAAARP